jgi:predicted GNAT superfamily acetyltransferase
MSDGLNAGIASDRFEVEWWLTAPRVVERAAREPQRSTWEQLVRAGAQEVFTLQFDSNGFARVDQEWEPHAPTLLAEIPSRLSELKTAAPDLAHAWRTRTRDFFMNAFSEGYACVDFLIGTRDGQERAAYVLSRAPLELGIHP